LKPANEISLVRRLKASHKYNNIITCIIYSMRDVVCVSSYCSRVVWFASNYCWSLFSQGRKLRIKKQWKLYIRCT